MARDLVVEIVAAYIPPILNALALNIVISIAADAIRPVRLARGHALCRRPLRVWFLAALVDMQLVVSVLVGRTAVLQRFFRPGQDS